MASLSLTSAFTARVAPAAAKFQAKARVARVAPALRKYAAPIAPSIIPASQSIIPGELTGAGWRPPARCTWCGLTHVYLRDGTGPTHGDTPSCRKWGMVDNRSVGYDVCARDAQFASGRGLGTGEAHPLSAGSFHRRRSASRSFPTGCHVLGCAQHISRVDGGLAAVGNDRIKMPVCRHRPHISSIPGVRLTQHAAGGSKRPTKHAARSQVWSKEAGAT